jgi:hypothetical protein
MIKRGMTAQEAIRVIRFVNFFFFLLKILKGIFDFGPTVVRFFLGGEALGAI